MKTKKIWISIWLISLLVTFIVSLVNNRPYLLMGGSSSVAPVMEQLMAKYPDNHKEVDFNYVSSASSGAPPRVSSNLFGIGWLSKEYKNPADKNLFSFQMMRDGLVIVYNLPKTAFKNSDKPPILDFSPKIVQELYLHNTSWKQAFPNEITSNISVQAFTRPNGSGTRDVFDEKVLDNHQFYTANTLDSSSAMLNLDPGGIGYTSLADILQAKSMNVTQGEWNGTKASIQTIKNGDYKLVRPFTGLINTNFPNSKSVAAILNWIFTSSAADTIFNKFGPKVPRNDAVNAALNQWLSEHGFPEPTT